MNKRERKKQRESEGGEGKRVPPGREFLREGENMRGT